MSTAHLQLESSPFDSIAEQYDAVFTESRIGLCQRSAVWTELKSAFQRGDRILEVGCGTGVDACYLARQGINVLACDLSGEMVRFAEQRVRRDSPGFQSASVKTCVWPAEEISTIDHDGLFDGAFSNFGALNCISDLRKFAHDLATLVKPSARVLLCLMGPCCLWEVAWFVVRGEWRRVFRRLDQHGTEASVGAQGRVWVRYPGVRAIRKMFAPEFRLRQVKGIGVLVPPTYVGTWANRFPGLLQVASQIDRTLSRCPGIRTLADHILLTFERTRI
jgi:ubiquinone/menaquinone biosynthesis C-methylase UbiE